MVRRTARTPQQSTRLRVYITNEVSKANKVLYPIKNFIYYKHMYPQYMTYITFISREQEPKIILKQ
jgi:hypothetical protein